VIAATTRFDTASTIAPFGICAVEVVVAPDSVTSCSRQPTVMPPPCAACASKVAAPIVTASDSFAAAKPRRSRRPAPQAGCCGVDDNLALRAGEARYWRRCRAAVEPVCSCERAPYAGMKGWKQRSSLRAKRSDDEFGCACLFGKRNPPVRLATAGDVFRLLRRRRRRQMLKSRRVKSNTALFRGVRDSPARLPRDRSPQRLARKTGRMLRLHPSIALTIELPEVATSSISSASAPLETKPSMRSSAPCALASLRTKNASTGNALMALITDTAATIGTAPTARPPTQRRS